MKTIIFLLFVFFAIRPNANCQFVSLEENEIIQILDKFILLENIPSNNNQFDCVVKLNTETEAYLYSVSITRISYKEEIPIDSLVCLKRNNVNFYIIKNDAVTIDLVKYENLSNIIEKEPKNKKTQDSSSVECAVIHLPSIRVFMMGKENRIFKSRLGYYEYFHPIEKLDKKYWPIENYINSITNLISFRYIDKRGNQTEAFKTLMKNGKGKFRINTK